MVTKAIVEEILSDYQVRVRIPLFDSIEGFKDATATKDLNIATICSMPKSHFIPVKGDIVFVTFEDNDLGKPIIIGCLSKESSNDSDINAIFNELISNSTTRLSKDTYIGAVTPAELKALKNIQGNIQRQLDILNERISKLEQGETV